MDLDSRDRRTLLWTGAFVVTSGLAFWGVYELTVQTSPGRLFADASLRGAALSGSALGDLVDRTLGVVTVASLLAALALIATIALVRLRRGLGLAAMGVLVVANVAGQLFKEFLLSRPDLGLIESAPATLNSLPSGHSTAAFSVVVALLIVVPGRLRHVLAATGGAYACLVALATMVAAWHRAADSVASFLLVGICAGLALVAVVLFDGGDAVEEGNYVPDLDRYRPWVMSAAVALALGLLLMGVLAAAEPVRESGFGLATAFLTGALLIVATGVGVLVAVLALIDRVSPLRR